MSVVAITPVTAARAGAVCTPAAANAGGNKFANTGREVVIVNNGDSTATAVTIPVTETVDGLAVASRVVSVVNATSKVIGPFPPLEYNDVDGNVNLTFDKVTSLTLEVIKVNPAN